MKSSKTKSLYILISEDTLYYIYAFSKCHAAQLWIFHLDSIGLLRDKLPDYSIFKIPNFIC